MECPNCGFHLINPGDRCARCRKPLAGPQSESEFKAMKPGRDASGAMKPGRDASGAMKPGRDASGAMRPEHRPARAL